MQGSFLKMLVLDWVGCSFIDMIPRRMHREHVLVRIFAVLGPAVATRHDEDCIRARCRVWLKYRFHHPVTEDFELGKSSITLFFCNLCTIIPASLSVSVKVETTSTDHLNLI